VSTTTTPRTTTAHNSTTTHSSTTTTQSTTTTIAPNSTTTAPQSTTTTTTPKPGSTTTNKPSPQVTLVLTNIQMDAFRPKNSSHTDFRTPSPCTSPTNDLIPIIVGCVLAGMVVVVLVAYLVGRRYRSASSDAVEKA